MKFCIFSAASIGGTFLDWSIHFLSGQTQFYSTRNNQFIQLSTNPINKKIGNAHGHLKNHPLGFEQTKLYLQSFNQDSIYSMYATTKKFTHTFKNKQDQFKENFKLFQEDQISDTNQLFELLTEQKIPTIHLTGESTIPLYFTKFRYNENYHYKDGKPESADDVEEEFHSFFFNNSINEWNALNLTDVWDIRERNALNIRPLDPIVDYCMPGEHLRINCREFWYNGIIVINRVMEYLDLSIDQDRFITWKEIYNEWRQQHVDAMTFVYNCDHIVSSIVNNWNYNIDLTFNQEVIVLHFLIYKYHLNLKSWQLKQFPSNTKDLHKLLEPNIHQVPKIY